MPKDQPEYLSLLWDEPPQTKEQFLLDQSTLLEMLVKEASEAEIKEANNRIEDSLPNQAWIYLPNGLLNNPRTPIALLMDYQPEPETQMWNWKKGIRDALNNRKATQDEVREETQGLSLESFLSRFL